MTLTAHALVCTLKGSPQQSSSDLITYQLLDEFRNQGVAVDSARVVDYDVRPGITADEGNGDEWPILRRAVLDADILLLATPTWVGHMSSVAQRVLERLDAELSETDGEGRPDMVGKVATAAVVGNEDGAHKVIADLFQGLNDIGFTIPAQGATYWNGEAMSGTDYRDLNEVPPQVKSTNGAVVRNAIHTARLLRSDPYPPYS
ncbi:flavodoxin family protein [Nocardia sp. BMG51109]|uniref:flavodoxin family protein n=1 Tax=Nocardia sp. BMG51109 TaxID=1056816 RepID=UPI000566D537